MPDIRALLKRFKKHPENRARDLTMRQVLSVTKTKSVPSWKQWKQLPMVLSQTEKRVVGWALITIIFCILLLLGGYVTAHRVDIPAVGGEYTEGLIGEPQFINPLYANNSDVDQDLSRLVYSGLVRWNPEQGFVPDLAQSIQISEDGMIYTFKIKENATFHNGEQVRARDVVFTFNAIQNPTYRSPLIDRFYNVIVQQEDEKTVSFILKEPFAPFLSYLTVGILPANLWAEILPQNVPLAALNLQPVGSGPYQFASFSKDKKGSIRSYTLKRNNRYYLQTPFIDELTFKFYPDVSALQEGLENKNVEGISIVEFEAKTAISENKNVQFFQPFLPRETVLYFNQESPVLADTAIRSAIASGINKQALIDTVYQGSGLVIHGPLLKGMLGYDQTVIITHDPQKASSDLTEAGYTIKEGTNLRILKESLQKEPEKIEEEGATQTIPEPTLLHLNLTTIDNTEMRAVASEIQKNLPTIGIETELNFVPADAIATTVIEPKKFELLLIPILSGVDPDLYPFWHSSQIKSPGLNIVGYKNIEADALLEKGRKEIDPTVREQTYREFQTLLLKDIPAVYLYQSTYGYAVSKKIHLPVIDQIGIPSDRFAHITDWYIKTKKVLQ